MPLRAQDPFEIHIYEYEPLRLRQYSLEAHLNFDAQGTDAREGTLLPTQHQTHLTLEPTAGISENFAGGDWQVCSRFSINLGTGFDLGPRGPGLLLKSRFEWHWVERR